MQLRRLVQLYRLQQFRKLTVLRQCQLGKLLQFI